MAGLTERAVPSGTQALAAALAAVLLASGCSASTTGSSPAPATSTADPDSGADVSKMDTGTYAIVPGHPYGTAGDDRFKQGMLEAQRLAAVTVGPWEVKPQLVGRGVVDLNAGVTGRFQDVASMRQTTTFQDPLPDIAARHGLIGGFSSLRVAPAENPKSAAKFWKLLIVVMRFPDAPSASAAAAEMAAAPPPGEAKGPKLRDVPLSADPAALAAAYPAADGQELVTSFTPHGELVLYQAAVVEPGDFLKGTMFLDAKSVVDSALSDQITKLKTFVPTPVDKLPDLPMDPSGFLMARMLENPSGSVPANIGAWTPAGWAHFEDDPLVVGAWLRDAGVDWIGQRLSTVYRTRNAEAAEALLQKVVGGMRATAPAKPAGEVPGLPRARCFERDSAAIYDESAASIQRIAWHFKCAAAADRYVFTVYGPSQQVVAQRISAQWRILAGK